MGIWVSPRALRFGRAVAITLATILTAAQLTILAIWIWKADVTTDIPYAAFSSAEGREVLGGLGVSVHWWVAYLVSLNLGVLGASVVAAYLIQRARPTWFGLYLALALVFFATAGSDVVHLLRVWFPGLAGAAIYVQGAAWMALFPVAYVFPTGTFVPKWSRWFAAAWVVYLPGSIIAGLTGMPGGSLDVILTLLLVCSCAIAQIYRYTKVSDTVGKHQARWVMVAFAVWFAIGVTLNASGLVTLYGQATPAGLAAYAVISLIVGLTLALIPAAVAIAIARHRLFDIDPWISRALVYATLTAFVTIIYELVVGGIGNLVTENYNTILTLAAGVVISLTFGPAGQLARRWVNRLVYGQRADPYAVLSRLAEKLAAAGNVDLAAEAIVGVVADAFAVPYAAIILGEQQRIAASVGTQAQDCQRFVVGYGGGQLGHLIVAHPKSGVPLSPADLKLLATIVNQCGPALHAATMPPRQRDEPAEPVTLGTSVPE